MAEGKPSVIDFDGIEHRKTQRRRRLHLLAFFIFVGTWELFGRSVSEILMAPPSKIVIAFLKLVINGELPHAILMSLQTLFVGFFISAVLGVSIGLAVGRSKTLAFIFEPFLNGLYATPLIALVPLVMLWFGMGFKGKVFFIMLVGLFPILINTMAGVRNVDSSLVEVGHSFKASRRQIFTEIIIPYSLPFILTGVRLGLGRAVVGMVLAEMYLALEGGLGALIMAYGASFSTAPLFASILVLSIIGVGTVMLVYWVEAKLTPWNENRTRS